METTVFKSATLKDAVMGSHVSAFSPVRENTNGYKFITFLKDRKATNVYLGRKSAEKIEVGATLNKEIASTAVIVLSTNEAGEQRLKLSFGGDSAYVQADALFDEAPATSAVSSAYKAEVLAYLDSIMEEAPVTTGNLTA